MFPLRVRHTCDESITGNLATKAHIFYSLKIIHSFIKNNRSVFFMIVGILLPEERSTHAFQMPLYCFIIIIVVLESKPAGSILLLNVLFMCLLLLGLMTAAAR